MEQPLDYEQLTNPFFDAYDAVPRDGPAVFVAGTDPGEQEPLRGQWISLDRDEQSLRRSIIDAVGASAVAAGAWRVIDQIRIGNMMLPEDLRPDELREEAIRQGAIARHPSSFRPGVELRLIDGDARELSR